MAPVLKGSFNDVKSEIHGTYMLPVSVIWCNYEALQNDQEVPQKIKNL